MVFWPCCFEALTASQNIYSISHIRTVFKIPFTGWQFFEKNFNGTTRQDGRTKKTPPPAKQMGAYALMTHNVFAVAAFALNAVQGFAEALEVNHLALTQVSDDAVHIRVV